MYESRFVEKDERLDLFARGEHVGSDFIYAGMFHNYQDGFLQSLANYFYRLLKGEDPDRVGNELREFLSNSRKAIGGNAIYRKKEVLELGGPFSIYKGDREAGFPRYKENSSFKIFELKVGTPSDMDKKSGLVFLKIKGYEDKKLDQKVVLSARRDLLDEWIRLTDDNNVRSYLEEVREVYKILEGFPLRRNEPLSKLAFYLFPIELSSFENITIVSKVSLYKRRIETRTGLWEDIMKNLSKEDRKDLEFSLEKHGKTLDHLKRLLDEALLPKNLDLLRKDWKKVIKKFLRGESNKIEAVFVGKAPQEDKHPQLSFGRYRVPSADLELSVFVEKDFQMGSYDSDGIAKMLSTAFSGFKFLGNVRVRINTEKINNLESLFGGEDLFRLIRGDHAPKNINRLENTDSINLIHSLCYFSTKILSLAGKIKEEEHRGRFHGALLILNTELKEEERYLLWDAVRLIYSYFGVPIQTVTKRSLRAMLDNEKRNAVIKNLLISLYKDTKTLEIHFSNLRLPKDVVVYAVIEKPSSSFFYRKGEKSDRARHYLYEIYRIEIKDKYATVELEKKIFELWGAEYSEIEMWLKRNMEHKNTRFCLITALRDSRLCKLYDELVNAESKDRFLVIRYDELKTAYFSEKTEKDCYIIYTEELEKLIERLGIKLQGSERKAVLAIKPAHIKAIEDVDEELYHPSLQLFFTERIGWERDETYSERKDLFIFTVLALSMFESESFQTPYSKLDIWEKTRDIHLAIQRDHKEYIFALIPTLYEMINFIKDMPRPPTEPRS